jgi:hypothetical protein
MKVSSYQHVETLDLILLTEPWKPDDPPIGAQPMTITRKAVEATAGVLALLLTPVISQAGASAAPIPEPDVVALLASGAIAAALVAKARKK